MPNSIKPEWLVRIEVKRFECGKLATRVEGVGGLFTSAELSFQTSFRTCSAATYYRRQACSFLPPRPNKFQLLSIL